MVIVSRVLGKIEVPKRLSDLTPAEISEVASLISNNAEITNTTQTVSMDYNGEHYKFRIGDTVSFNVDDNEYDFRIIGFNHDDLTTATAYGKATATGKAGITFQMIDCLNTKYQMNSNATAINYWDTCELHTTHLPIFKNTMDTAWSDIIKKVDKKTSAGNRSSTINTSSEDLFLLSEIEIFGSTPYSFAGEGDQYAYWAANNKNAARMKHVNGSMAVWWERSPRSSSSGTFCSVGSGGSAGSSVQYSSYGVAFGFCV